MATHHPTTARGPFGALGCGPYPAPQQIAVRLVRLGHPDAEAVAVAGDLSLPLPHQGHPPGSPVVRDLLRVAQAAAERIVTVSNLTGRGAARSVSNQACKGNELVTGDRHVRMFGKRTWIPYQFREVRGSKYEVRMGNAPLIRAW